MQKTTRRNGQTKGVIDMPEIDELFRLRGNELIYLGFQLMVRYRVSGSLDLIGHKEVMESLDKLEDLEKKIREISFRKAV